MGHDLPVGAWPQLIELITEHTQGTATPAVPASTAAAQPLQTSAT